jgi:hypothetical protein
MACNNPLDCCKVLYKGFWDYPSIRANLKIKDDAPAYKFTDGELVVNDYPVDSRKVFLDDQTMNAKLKQKMTHRGSSLTTGEW